MSIFTDENPQKLSFSLLFVLLSLAFFSHGSQASVDTGGLTPQDESTVTIWRSTTGRGTNRATGEITDEYYLFNKREHSLVGPLVVEVIISPADGAELANAADVTTGGNPVILIDIPELAPGTGVKYDLVFKNAKRFTYTQKVYSQSSHGINTDSLILQNGATININRLLGGGTNRKTGEITDIYNLGNRGVNSLRGPLVVEVIISPADGAELANAADVTTGGNPVIIINIPELVPGSYVLYDLVFKNAKRFTYTLKVYSQP